LGVSKSLRDVGKVCTPNSIQSEYVRDEYQTFYQFKVFYNDIEISTDERKLLNDKKAEDNLTDAEVSAVRLRN